MCAENTNEIENKNLIEIFNEIQLLRDEILFYIKNFLPSIDWKRFPINNIPEINELNRFQVMRQFRMMCLMFKNRLKRYNLDPRSKVIVFLKPECSHCGKHHNLDIHHKFRDGRDDRAIFQDYEVYIWSYYLIHLDEADERLKILCKDCHENVHQGTGNNLFDQILGDFGL